MAVGLAALIVVGAVFGLRSKSTPVRPAPALPTSAVLGQPVTLAQLHGKPAFVVFWASWCPPCAHEAPAVESFARQVAGRAHVIGVDWDDTDGGARKFARTHGWTFTSMSNPRGVVGARFGLTDLPTTYLIDRRGRIIDRLVGEQTVSSLKDALSRA